MKANADIGVFGGSGFYSLLNDVKEVDIDTKYGKPSDKISIADISGVKVAFLPRHGKNHQYPPHKIPYKANVAAMKALGVKGIIGPNACGSLQSHIKPGDFVICDQFVNRTTGREDTFFDGPEVKHISPANPYDENLRRIAIETCKELGITVHENGTIVVIQGPRFSTTAESRWYQKMGWEVINMTQYPESYLALEMEIPYVNISLITDYDVGLFGRDDIKPATHDEVLKVFDQNLDKLKTLLYKMVEKI